jgi:hypothetical protein
MDTTLMRLQKALILSMGIDPEYGQDWLTIHAPALLGEVGCDGSDGMGRM